MPPEPENHVPLEAEKYVPLEAGHLLPGHEFEHWQASRSELPAGVF